MPNSDWAGRPVLASIVNGSSFLVGDLHLGKLGETVVVHGYAPHNGPRSFVSHLVGNRAGFPCTKAPMLAIAYPGPPHFVMVPLPAAASGDLLPPLPPFSGFNLFSSVETRLRNSFMTL